MAATYGITNLVSSFGFCWLWRKQCVSIAAPREGMVVYDLMSGMGECWPTIARRVGSSGRIVGLDFSSAMVSGSEPTRRRLTNHTVEMLEEDVLRNSIPDSAADCVVSAFGLKTFSSEQLSKLAGEIARILRPGGTFTLLEISVPGPTLLRTPYMFYLKRCIPIIGTLFLGNPDNYRMLGVYTEAFQNCTNMVSLLRRHELKVELRRLFFGCATMVRGQKSGMPQTVSGG